MAYWPSHLSAAEAAPSHANAALVVPFQLSRHNKSLQQLLKPVKRIQEEEEEGISSMVWKNLGHGGCPAAHQPRFGGFWYSQGELEKQRFINAHVAKSASPMAHASVVAQPCECSSLGKAQP